MGESAISNMVPDGLRVLTAIEFNDQFCLEANEVEHVALERHLAFELQPIWVSLPSRLFSLWNGLMPSIPVWGLIRL